MQKMESNLHLHSFAEILFCIKNLIFLVKIVHFEIIYFSESDVLPKFTSNPVSSHSNKTGGRLTISRCQISSKIPLYDLDAYYLKNGFERIIPLDFKVLGPFEGKSPLLDIREDRDFIDGEPSEEMFRQLVIPVSNYTHEGFYQCVVNIPGAFATTIISKNADVQFIGKLNTCSASNISCFNILLQRKF